MLKSWRHRGRTLKPVESGGEDSGTSTDPENNRLTGGCEEATSDWSEEGDEPELGGMRFHLGGEVEDSDPETFAGKRYCLGLENFTIRSSKGSVRGVKNRVRAGIATFLQRHASKSWEERECGEVVVYMTTLGVIRETYQRCLKVRHILRTHLVKYTERDLFMSRDLQAQIQERMGTIEYQLPQVFIEGQHLGDADTIEKLNETGELRKILKPYKNPDVCSTCNVCGGYRLLPCPSCNGSKKSVHRNHFSSELIALKCMNCDEVGLVKCHAC